MSYVGIQQPTQTPDGSGVATPPTGYAVLVLGSDKSVFAKFSDGTVLPLAAAVGAISALFSQNQTVTVANTAVETTLLGTGSGSLTLAAGFFASATGIEIQGWGFHSAVSSPNIRIRIYLDSTVILDTGNVSSGNSTNALVQLKAQITCYTTGVTGTIQAQGFYQESGGGTNNFQMVNTSPITIDTTVSHVLNVTVQWGTASASNTISLTNFTAKEVP